MIYFQYFTIFEMFRDDILTNALGMNTTQTPDALKAAIYSAAYGSGGPRAGFRLAKDILRDLA